MRREVLEVAEVRPLTRGSWSAVEKPTAPYDAPVMNEVCATSFESAEIRVRLGMPGQRPGSLAAQPVSNRVAVEGGHDAAVDVQAHRYASLVA